MEAEDFGGSTVLVRAVPADVEAGDVEALVCELAAKLARGSKDAMSEKTEWVLHSIACKAAIKAGDRSDRMELLRLAFPRRVFTLSQTEYVIDRVKWLFDHRDLVGGLRFVHEPATLRFFTGVLEPTSDWPEKLAAVYRADFGDEQ